MKSFKYLSIGLASLLIFIACQKELSVESGFAGKVAVGSLLDSANNCRNIAINGTYTVDGTLTSDNYVTVNVNITEGGRYTIFTDTQNGFSFGDSGFLAPGPQTVRLKATGRPLLAKQTTFTVSFDTSFCSFSINVIGNTPAVFSLAGTPGACSSANVQGNFATGTALTAANTVALQVNVTSLGSYNITTTPVGGMSFSGSGNFTTLGAQSITLQGSGTPTTAGTNSIPVAAGTSNCSFNVTVTTGTTNNNTADNTSDTAWRFTAGGKNYQGPFYDVFDSTINGAKGIIFLGFNQSGADTTIQFGAFSTTGTFPPSSVYSSKSGLSAFYFTDFATDTSGVDIYTANPPSANNPTPVEDIKLTITAYDATSGFVSGIFSGTALNAAGAPVPITNGRFRAMIR